MILGIVGSRKCDLNDKKFIFNFLDKIINHINPSEIVSGGAKGADTYAEMYADENNIEFSEFLPNLEIYPYVKYKSKAYFIRNQKIVDYCDMLVAFIKGKSTGTKDTIKKAMKKEGMTILIQILGEEK